MRSMSEMPYHMVIKGKLYLDDHKKHIVAINDGAKRYVYNHLVATNNKLYQLRKINIPISLIENRMDYLKSTIQSATAIKNAAPFLYDKDVDSDVVLHAIANYRTAWKNQKERHTGVPAFHKKRNTQSYQTSNHYKKDHEHMNDGSIRFLDSKHIQLPKMGRVRIGVSKKVIKKLLSRTAITRIGTVTISKDAVGEYWFSMSLASEEPFYEELKHTGSSLGIDLNLDNFLTDSENNVIDNPRFLKNMEEKLKKAQKKLSCMYESAKKDKRNLRDSRNYQKQRREVAYLHRLISRQRANFQNVLSMQIVKNHDFIAAEDLKASNLVKNHKLAKAISDVSWRSFITKLQYKAGFYNKKVVLVNPRNTTQTCSVCGNVLKNDDKLTLNDRDWVCPICGTYHLRDYNAAINILNRALEKTA